MIKETLVGMHVTLETLYHAKHKDKTLEFGFTLFGLGVLDLGWLKLSGSCSSKDIRMFDLQPKEVSVP